MSHLKPELTIILPAFNEQNSILKTLNSLLYQVNENGLPLDHSCYQLVVIDNASTDHTAEVVKRFQAKHEGFSCLLISEREKGVVAARKRGFDYIANHPDLATAYLASADADIIFHPFWITSILKNFKMLEADVLAYPGAFPLTFWKRVPLLFERYVEEIGSMFFNKETITWGGLRGRELLFTEQIYFDFGRPVSDGCFAISRDAYLKAGGYKQEFVAGDAGQPKELYWESLRVVFRLCHLNLKLSYINDAPFSEDPRRMLVEAKNFATGESYQTGTMTDLRDVDETCYEHLDNLAKEMDFMPIQKSFVEAFILRMCMMQPDLVKKNTDYFGGRARELEREVRQWWQERPLGIQKGTDIFTFSQYLVGKYFEVIFKNLPKQIVK